MIYCVEDDSNIRELIVYTLETTGMKACGFPDGEALMKALESEMPGLILLDIMLPGEDGIRLLSRLKAAAKWKDIPVIMVTAKGSEYDKVIGLDSGADDYITKPFGMMELVSRVKAVLRRTQGKQEAESFTVGGLVLDIGRHEARVEGEKILLTLKEFELLEQLVRHPGMVFSRDQLLDQIWGYSYEGETRTVDVHIRTLRQKLKSAGRLIETVRGVGYRIGGTNET